ncbi:MAG: xanthine dehydrogenase family protein molybdopterin-binding subunit [Cyclobacteriaceae bacterium]|nr:xanthine dehydrogenase family protein molybdopterin-binding subunit [Cyclobacteriaceae bacterium]
MSIIKTTYNRRSFLKASIAGGGGLMLSFSWLAACSPSEATKAMPSAWFDLNAYLSIADNGEVTIMSPNPEVGQNVKTSMPMIIAEELDVKWEDVIVKQAPLNSVSFTRQVAGGSQSIRQGWQSLRMAGATAREMLKNAAAKQWNVNAADCTTAEGYVMHGSDKLSYGEIATMAAGMAVPEEVKLKDPSTYKIIGTDRGNVDIDGIITGQPLFGLDTRKEGMQYAVVLRPPAFGLKLKSFDDAEARKVNGVSDVIQFGSKVAVLAKSTWAAMKGQRALKAEWEKDTMLESTSYHDKTMRALLDKKAAEPKRSDGNAKAQFASADKVFEKVYEAPFLPHNAMEPMNFYANVTAEKAEFIGPIQTPERTRSQIAELLGRPESEVTIDMTRMGGGFGRRLYGDFALEAAEVSKIAKTPVMVVFSREDDMTAGTYRPASKYKFKAAIKDGNMVAYHLVGAGVNMGNSTRENNFPASTLDHYLVESHNLESNITTGAWRAPITNFLAYAEQSFFDELASELGKDPVQFRLDLFARAKENPVGELQYDVDKSVGVIKLAAEKSNWGNAPEGVYQGFSTYYSHNTYVAEVAEVVMQGNTPVVKRVVCAIDCGIVVNPVAAINQVQGGVIDGIGHAMYGDFSFENGQPQTKNFDKYRLIRMKEAPEVEVHFVKSTNDPTGLGEPALPPAGGAIANAIAKATGKRFYKQPFIKEQIILG